MGLDVESFIGMTRKLWKKFETQTLYYGYVWISKKVCSYGNIQFCKGTTSPSCYFWPQDMIPSCGLHRSIDKWRNQDQHMLSELLRYKHAVWYEYGVTCGSSD